MTVQTLVATLLSMPSRQAQLLRFRFVEGRGADECAALYGVGRPELDVLLWRAALAFDGQPDVVPDAQRDEQVRRFVAALDADASDGLTAPLAALRRNAAEVRVALEQAAAAEEASPKRHREIWLRRAAIVVVLALTAYFYFQQQDRDAKKPRYEPRSLPSQPR